MSWKRAVVALAAVLIGLAAVATYNNLFVSDFEIVNASGAEVERLSVVDGSKVWPLGRLRPGGSKRFRAHLTGEGGLEVSWVAAGRRYAGAIGNYYTNGVPVRGCKGVITAAGLNDSCPKE